MKKLWLLCMTLFVVMSARADVVTFDFSTAEGLTEMGVDPLPTTDSNGYNLEGRTLRLGGIEITTRDSNITHDRIWANTTTATNATPYELRTYSKNAILISTAKGVSILGLEIQSRYSVYFAELSTNTQLYDTVSSITLTSTNKNQIQKIILITTGNGSSDSIPTTNPDTIHSTEDTLSISVTSAIEIGSLLSANETTPRIYEITGYISNMETTSENYATWGDQNFWITDTKGSTANTNALGALHVYKGVTATEAKVGDKVKVVSAIKNYANKNIIETVAKAPVTILETNTDTVPVVNPDTAVHTGLVTFDFSTAEGLAALGVDSLPTTGSSNGYNLEGRTLRMGGVEITTKDVSTPSRIWAISTATNTTTYELRTYVGNTLIINTAKGVSILGIEIESNSINFAELSTKTQLYDTVSSITLTSTGRNNIKKITLVTTGKGSSDSIPTINPDYDAETERNVIVKLLAPKNSPCDIEIVTGSMENGWSKGILMSLKNGIYTGYINTTEAARFKFRAEGDLDNEIYYTTGTALENLICGDFMIDDKTQMFVDLSDESRYMWIKPSTCEQMDYYNITAKADDSKNGSVSGSGDYARNETAVLLATPNTDCEFVQWSDGSVLNPRSVRVLEDAVYIAEFRRNVPLPQVESSDIMYFTSADTVITATRVYNPSEITAYDKLIIATEDNKNVIGSQNATGNIYRQSVDYTPYMSLSDVSVVEVFPNGNSFRLKVEDGFLAPRCTNCGSKPNQLFAEADGGADWHFVKYGNSVVPQAVSYAQRMILYNELAPRFSSYRQVTGLDRLQTTVFKLSAPRIIPQDSVQFAVDSTATNEEKDVIEDITTEIAPKDTSVVITTPFVDFVYKFILIIWADEAHTKVLVMITYDSQGRQLSVTRPNAVRRLAAEEEGDVSFEVGDLTPDTSYDYTLTACEDDGSILKTLNNAFSTKGKSQGLETLNTDNTPNVLKRLVNGQILIFRGDKIYTVTGQEVK